MSHIFGPSRAILTDWWQCQIRGSLYVYMLKSNWIISPQIGMKIPQRSHDSEDKKKLLQLDGSHPSAKGSMENIWEIYGLRLATFSRGVVCRWCDVNVVVMWVDICICLHSYGHSYKNRLGFLGLIIHRGSAALLQKMVSQQRQRLGNFQVGPLGKFPLMGES